MTKVVEKPGVSIHTGMAKNNPYPRPECGRDTCPYLRAGQECLELCSKENVVYEAECTKCEDAQIEEGSQTIIRKVYYGETSRTLHHRSKQHLGDQRRAVGRLSREDPNTIRVEPEQSSWIMDHALECHGGAQGLDPARDIRFSVRRGHRDPLSRQIEEAVLVTWGLERGLAYGHNDKPEPIVCLNRKEESFGPRIRVGKPNH